MEIAPKKAIIVSLENKVNLLFQLCSNTAYKAQPTAAPNIHKSPEVNFKLISKLTLPLTIIEITPTKHNTKPKA